MNAPFTPIEDPRPLAPQVFVRAIGTPSGLPWDQFKAADLDARMAAPAPIGELQYRVVRIEPWAFGRPGRFGALYLRARDAVEGFVAEASIDGRPISAVFVSPEVRLRQARRRVYALVGACLLTAVLGLAVLSAFGARADRQDRLEALQREGQRADRTSAQLLLQTSRAKFVDEAGLRHRELSDALRDLRWAARAKSPLAHIQAVHWEKGMMTVTTRGETPPFVGADREVRRFEQPVGRGLWLWGVGPATGGEAAP